MKTPVRRSEDPINKKQDKLQVPNDAPKIEPEAQGASKKETKGQECETAQSQERTPNIMGPNEGDKRDKSETLPEPAT